MSCTRAATLAAAGVLYWPARPLPPTAQTWFILSYLPHGRVILLKNLFMYTELP